MGYYNDNDNNKIRRKKISNNKDSNKKSKHSYTSANARDKKALDSYNRYCDKFTQAVCDYESKYGALTNFGYESSEYP
ncbi:spore coat protein CotJB, partial [Clostridioides difficile]